MTTAPVAHDEAARLQTLQELQLLDTAPDPVLDGLVAVAARALGCPVALFSVVDSGRQWFKAVQGLSVRETPRDLAFCAHAIAGDTLFEVPDALADPRFADNPLVLGEPGVRFYAGMPVGLSGHRLGTLCVIDRVPRTLNEDERSTLIQLAQAVDHWIAAHAERQAQVDRERSFRELAEQIPAIVYRTGLHGETAPRYISPRLHALGYEPADWVARASAWWLAVHPQDRVRVRQVLDAAIASETTSTLQYRMRDAQGGWHHMHDTARVVRAGADGAPVLQGVMLDITEAVGQQDQLRKLSAAADQAAESIYITDLQGAIEYVNDAGVQHSGYARDEMLGRNPRMFQSGRTPDTVYTELWRELGAGRRWNGVLFNQRKDGAPLIESASISPVCDADGAVTHYVAVKQDITEKQSLRAELEQYRTHLDALVARRTEALEQARAEAEAASTAKSAFLAAMSHEIRTPMSGVIGVIELLERSSLLPEQKELTDIARESAGMLLGLIDNILDFSKIEAGRMVLEDAPLDPAHLVEMACDALQPIAHTRDVQLHVFADPALPPQVRGDAVRLRQIVTNLVGNAIKFSAGLDRRGRVSVRLGWTSDAGLALAVADNGIGMCPEVQSRLFTPFEQAEPGTTRKHGGTGLGLAICRRLADAMGGRITLASTPDAGSCFDVTLPLPMVPDAAPRTYQDLSGLQCCLLVADDEWARDWASYLRAAGAQVLRDSEPPQRPDAATVWIAQTERLGAQLPPGAGVLLHRGQRATPRQEGPQCVALDVPGLRRGALLAAVAIAAGRAMPAGPTVASMVVDQGMHILVAEDNETNRRVLQRQLRLLGVHADIASDGSAALAMWRQAGQRYALLLTDLHMPELDGYGLCAAIRSEEDSTRRLPIIALTANALLGEAENCKAAGMDDFLSKPVPIERLRAALLRWSAPDAADHGDKTPTNTVPADAAGEDGPASGTMPGEPRVLLVDDDPLVLAQIASQLRAMHPIPVETFSRAAGLIERLQAVDGSNCMALIDLNMPGMDGIELIRHLAEGGFAGALALASGADRRVLETAARLAKARGLRVLGHLPKPVADSDLCALMARWNEVPAARATADAQSARPDEIRRAIVGGELRLAYQPQIDIATGALAGVEALVRWQHPRKGLLPPSYFVQVAEEHGMVEPLTRAVLDLALAQTRAWQDRHGLRIRVAVNVSMDNLMQLDFAEYVVAQLARHGIAAQDLVLEVTETRLMKDMRAPLDILTRLRMRGIGLSIDDFGTGHSSLAQLRDLPFDELKVDRSFVHGGRDDPTLRAILTGSVEMAQQLGMRIVAEGVEDTADWALVRQAGCTEAQGYLMAKPMPGDALPQWLADWPSRRVPLMEGVTTCS